MEPVELRETSLGLHANLPLAGARYHGVKRGERAGEPQY